MARIFITNKKKDLPVYKAFDCKIGDICAFIKFLDDTLYHDGINAKPVDGDKIYIKEGNDQINQEASYVLFTNNSAIIILETETNIKNAIVTNQFGVCTLTNCTRRGKS